MTQVNQVKPAEQPVVLEKKGTNEEQVQQESKEQNKSVWEKGKEGAQIGIDKTKKLFHSGVEGSKELYQKSLEKGKEVKEYTVDTIGNMDKGMKYSAIGVGSGFGLTVVTKLVSGLFKNKTALNILKGFGKFGAFAGIASLIAYGIFATKKNNQNIVDLNKVNIDLELTKNEKQSAIDLAAKNEREKDEALAKAEKAEQEKADAIKAKEAAEAKAKKAEEEKAEAIKAKEAAEVKAKEAEENTLEIK